ncbi:MAG: hypothetical protein ACFBWO_07640 [Paracoccaceae bacterium]
MFFWFFGFNYIGRSKIRPSEGNWRDVLSRRYSYDVVYKACLHARLILALREAELFDDTSRLDDIYEVTGDPEMDDELLPRDFYKRLLILYRKRENRSRGRPKNADFVDAIRIQSAWCMLRPLPNDKEGITKNRYGTDVDVSYEESLRVLSEKFGMSEKSVERLLRKNTSHEKAILYAYCEDQGDDKGFEDIKLLMRWLHSQEQGSPE